MGYNYCGALGYADDLILLSPTVSSMKMMLGICETYAKKHKINFNAKKSLFLFFPGMKDNKCGANFYLNGERLAYVNSAKHIGHIINSSVTGIFDLKDVISRFSKSVNMLMAQVRSVSSAILIKLFNQYCCCFFGLVLCDLKSKMLQQSCVQRRKAIKRILRISNLTHTRFLYHISQCVNIELMAKVRIVKFFLSCVHSGNCLIRNISKRCMYQTFSNMGRNISHINMEFDYILHRQAESNYVLGCVKRMLLRNFKLTFMINILLIYVRSLLM